MRMFSDGELGDESTRRIAPLEGSALPPNEVDISLYNMTELLALRNRIDSMLPPMQMSKLNLEEEVVRQFMTVKALQGAVLSSNEESNKKASVVNACASALQTLAKMQVELHDAERFKKIEAMMVKYIKLLPMDIATKFLNDYANLSLDKA
jgi:hypothetical protein